MPIHRALPWTLILAMAVPYMACSDPQSNNPTARGTEHAQHDAVEVARVVEANTAFAFDLYAMLRTQSPDEENLTLSPWSISSALAMLYAGARGTTADEMRQTMHLPHGQLHQAYGELIGDLDTGDDAPYELAIANRLWGEQGFDINPDYLAITRDHYQAPVELLDFEGAPEDARQIINAWVEERTRDRVKDLLPDDAVTADTRLVLTNAIYFKGTWITPFDEHATYDEPFHAAGEASISVPMMHAIYDFPYARVDGARLLSLPYEGDRLSMVFVLPDDIGGFGALEEQLDPETLDEWLDEISLREVNVTLPRFKIESTFGLNDTLIELGMPLLFTRDADLSGIPVDTILLWVSAAFHKAFVEVNEEGAEAAAATAMVVVAESALIADPDPPEVFRADHPFLYLIRDDISGSILFMGRVGRPESGFVTGESVPSAESVRGETQGQEDNQTRFAESRESESTNPWLTASLYGNDNEDAALRKVMIRTEANKLRIRIQNQFDFECSLSFDSNGDPALLADCVSQAEPSPVCNPDMPESECAKSTGCFRTQDESDPACFFTWVAKEPMIILSCITLEDEEVCSGEYTLETTEGYSGPAAFTIARRL